LKKSSSDWSIKLLEMAWIPFTRANFFSTEDAHNMAARTWSFDTIYAKKSDPFQIRDYYYILYCIELAKEIARDTANSDRALRIRIGYNTTSVLTYTTLFWDSHIYTHTRRILQWRWQWLLSWLALQHSKSYYSPRKLNMHPATSFVTRMNGKRWLRKRVLSGILGADTYRCVDSRAVELESIWKEQWLICIVQTSTSQNATLLYVPSKRLIVPKAIPSGDGSSYGCIPLSGPWRWHMFPWYMIHNTCHWYIFQPYMDVLGMKIESKYLNLKLHFFICNHILGSFILLDNATSKYPFHFSSWLRTKERINERNVITFLLQLGFVLQYWHLAS
jgi:hypothetical protein